VEEKPGVRGIHRKNSECDHGIVKNVEVQLNVNNATRPAIGELDGSIDGTSEIYLISK
jgi:hypothetical protein